MNKQELNEKLFDQVLIYITQKQMEERPNDMTPDEMIEHEITFRPEFENRMNKLFAGNIQKKRAARIRRMTFRIGIAAAILIAISFTVVFSVDALRVPILNLFTYQDQQSTTIRIDEKADYSSFSDKIKGLYLPEYIPATYSVHSITDMNTTYSVVFQNTKGQIIRLQKYDEGDSVGIDNEDTKIENLTVNNEPAQYYEKNGTNTLFFEYSHNAFTVYGNVPKDELLRMAEGMKLRP